MARTTFLVRSFRIEWYNRRRISRNFDFCAKIAKFALGSFEFEYGVCGLLMGRSTTNVGTQFWDVRQFLWKWVDTVQMLHIVDMLQMLQMLSMIQMKIYENLRKVDKKFIKRLIKENI